MARCGCSGGSCSCQVQGAGSVTVTGSGSDANPYIISGGGSLNVTDTPTVNLTKTGVGSAASPYDISAVATLTLDDLTNVEAAAATTGQVIARQSDGVWRPVAPSTATPGAITVSGGIEGDGSGGSPLSVKLPASSGLVEDSTGLRVEGSGAWASYTPVLTTAGAGADPTVGNGTLAGRWTRIGMLVFFKIVLIAGTTTSRGSGALEVTLPVPAIATPIPQTLCHFHAAAVGSGDFPGEGLISGSQVIRSYLIPGPSGRGAAASHSTPATFQSGSQFIWSGSYEAA